MKDELISDLVNALIPHTDMGTQDLKMTLTIILNKYEITKAETALTIYEGDINEQILKRFIAAKIAKGCSMRTIRYYRNDIAKSLERIGKPYTDITPDDIRYLLAVRIERDKVSKTTVNNERRNLSSFFGWLQTEEILLKNPMSKVDRIKETKRKKKAYSLLDLEKIRLGCRTNRERAVVEFLASTWCRVSELCEVKITDISDGKVVVHGKGDKYRECFINARAALALEMYLSERKDNNPYLFPKSTLKWNEWSKIRENQKDMQMWYIDPRLVSQEEPSDKSTIESIVRKIGKRAGVEKVHPHRFRRTGATLALRAGMPLTTVSKLLGHESVETTQIYLDISDEELEQAHKKYVV